MKRAVYLIFSLDYNHVSIEPGPALYNKVNKSKSKVQDHQLFTQLCTKQEPIIVQG